MQGEEGGSISDLVEVKPIKYGVGAKPRLGDEVRVSYKVRRGSAPRGDLLEDGEQRCIVGGNFLCSVRRRPPVSYCHQCRGQPIVKCSDTAVALPIAGAAYGPPDNKRWRDGASKALASLHNPKPS